MKDYKWLHLLVKKVILATVWGIYWRRTGSGQTPNTILHARDNGSDQLDWVEAGYKK